MHGAFAGAPEGKANGAYRHGVYTQDWLELKRETSELLRQAKAVNP